MNEALTQAERFPWLTGDSQHLLSWLHEHPAAPRFNHHCGDRLTAAGLERIRQFELELNTAAPGWLPGEIPAWLDEFTEACFRDVPFYRRYGARPAGFMDVPGCSRADISREPWSFVPDTIALEDLIVYNTSGTTGQPLDILSHPETSSKYLPLLRAALSSRGVKLDGGRDPRTGQPRVAIVLVCFQRRTFTYASVSAFLDGAGFAKINLNPADWRDPDDRVRFLDDCQPEIITGDPISFAELARLPLRHQPKALISTAMQLLPGLRQRLEAHFGCPVLDLYAMNEAGPIAVGVPAGAPSGHALLQHRLYVEILDPDGRPCLPGQRGEIALSGGFNPFIPLLRYRTGDYASLRFTGSRPVLAELEGRPPVIFRGEAGQAINNIDITGALRPFALPRWRLHQAAGGALTLQLPAGTAERDHVLAALLNLFGPAQVIEVVEAETLDDRGSKTVQYTREEA